MSTPGGHLNEKPSAEERRRVRDQRMARNARVVMIGGGAMALAAALLLVTQSGAPPIDPDHRGKGGLLELAVFTRDDQGVHRVDEGAVVHPGTRLGFAARTPDAGFLAIFGWDAGGAVYMIHPATPDADAFGPATTLRQIDAAVELDEALVAEHIAAVFCRHDFALAAFMPAPTNPDADDLRRRVAADARCALRELTLDKRR